MTRGVCDVKVLENRKFGEHLDEDFVWEACEVVAVGVCGGRGSHVGRLIIDPFVALGRRRVRGFCAIAHVGLH